MLYLLFTSYHIMWTLISLPLQMAERLRRAQPVSVANHVKARQSLIVRAITWLATESGWARSKRSTICSGKQCGGFIIFELCCPYAAGIRSHCAPMDHLLTKAEDNAIQIKLRQPCIQLSSPIHLSLRLRNVPQHSPDNFVTINIF